MVLSLALSDDLYAAYVKHSPQNPQKGIAKQLERFKEVSPAEHTLVFSQKHLKKLAELTKTGFDTPEDLIKALERALSVDVAGVSVPLTDSQRKRVESFATFFAEPTKDYLTRRIKEMVSVVFGS